MKPQFLVIYRPPRPTFVDDITEEEGRIVGEHFEYLKRLLEGDPAVKGRVFRGELRSYRMALMSQR